MKFVFIKKRSRDWWTNLTSTNRARLK